MKVIFMGAPAFAVPSLMAVAGAGSDIAAVYTKAPKRAGRRGLELTKSPVHRAAELLGIRVETPSTLRDRQAQAELRDLGADIAIVAAYGLLLPAEILAAPRLGCFNLHASLLPRWRGAAPVQRAIMAGDVETGVSIMRMEVGLDTGPIAGELRTPIDPGETSEELTARLAELAANSIGDNWRALINGQLAFAPQGQTGVVYAKKIDKSEAPIDWTASATSVRNHIHGLSAFPGAITGFQVGGRIERLKLLRAELAEPIGRPGEILDDRMTIACGTRSIRALQVQRAGRNVISGAEFMRSGAAQPGALLVAPS
jgi:methionyl-tRNA formyltransferase